MNGSIPTRLKRSDPKEIWMKTHFRALFSWFRSLQAHWLMLVFLSLLMLTPNWGRSPGRRKRTLDGNGQTLPDQIQSI